MSFITPSGWTRTSGYPKIEGNKQGTSLVDKFYCAYDITDIFTNLPQLNALYDEDAVIADISSLRFASFSIEPTDSKNHAFITMTYQPIDIEGGGGGGGNEGIATYFLENGTLEKSLETHPDYLMKWNYNLYEFIETDSAASAVPAWAGTATNQSNASGLSKENEYAWSKEKPSGGYISGTKTYDWIKVQDMIKPGVESYILPSPVIQEKKYYNQKVSAEQAGSQVGKILTPSETFGITGGEWLVMSASVQLDGRKYLVERSFQYAKDWDGDLYANA